LSFSRRSEYLLSVSKNAKVQIFPVMKNVLLKTARTSDLSSMSTMGSTGQIIETERVKDKKQGWFSKICKTEKSLKTLTSDKFSKGALVSFDEGNDTLIIVT